MNLRLFYRYRQRHIFFVSAIFDILDVMREQRHRSALDSFLNVTKNDDVVSTCKRTLSLLFYFHSGSGTLLL